MFVIDGNIGSGKTTLLNNLNELGYGTVKLENIDRFKPWLNLYYSNMYKFALGFQMEVLLSHIDNTPLESDNILIERSPLSCIEIFGRHLLDIKILSPEEHDLCVRLNDKFGWIPKKIIYIKTDPKVCQMRIQERNRNSEEMISLGYLQAIDKLYNKLYIDNNRFLVHIIDGNQEKEQVLNDILTILKN